MRRAALRDARVQPLGARRAQERRRRGVEAAGQNVLNGKPSAVISCSIGTVGGFGANHHLRQSLMFCNVPLLQQPEVYVGNASKVFDDKGKITSPETIKFLTNFGAVFHHWIAMITHRH